MKSIYLTIAVCFSLLWATSQSYIPGQVYYGLDSFIEYRAGNLPLILSAPHGGYETPSSLPDRVCTGCVTGRDSYTQELTREIAWIIQRETGCYPHVIINRLHRKKLDANRDIIEATDSNLVTEPYWHEYMNFCDSAKQKVSAEFAKGLFFDIHGHGHTIQRLELGYLMSGTDLRRNDSSLNASAAYSRSSILNLKFSNLNSHTHAELIRGEHSFGAMIERKGFDAVPSDSIPFPLLGEPFFNGGYNTRRFGSAQGGTIDAIQIESHQGVRFNAATRLRYADSLAHTMLEYLEKHYFVNFSNGYCNFLSTLPENAKKEISLFPNPSNEFVTIKGIDSQAFISLFSIDGKFAFDQKIGVDKTINISSLSPGLYVMKIKTSDSYHAIKFVKK